MNADSERDCGTRFVHLNRGKYARHGNPNVVVWSFVYIRDLRRVEWTHRPGRKPDSHIQGVSASCPQNTISTSGTSCASSPSPSSRSEDTLRRYRREKDWYAYREEALRQIAIEWCEENGIEYTES